MADTEINVRVRKAPGGHATTLSPRGKALWHVPTSPLVRHRFGCIGYGHWALHINRPLRGWEGSHTHLSITTGMAAGCRQCPLALHLALQDMAPEASLVLSRHGLTTTSALGPRNNTSNELSTSRPNMRSWPTKSA